MINMLSFFQVPLGPPIQGLGNFLPDASGASGPMQIENLFTTIFGFLTIVGGLAFLIYFILGALNWIMGGDDKTKVDTAKKYMTNGAIGLIIIIATYAIVWIVGNVLGLRIFSPAETIDNIMSSQSGSGTTGPNNQQNGLQAQ